MGTGDAECLVCCVKSDLRVGGFVLSMGCGRQTEHAEREVRWLSRQTVGMLFCAQQCMENGAFQWNVDVSIQQHWATQCPPSSEHVKQVKTSARRNFSKKTLEAYLENLPNPSAAAHGHPVMVLQFNIRMHHWIHWNCSEMLNSTSPFTFGLLICAALSAFSGVSSRYCVVFGELNKPSGTLQTRESYSFSFLS